MNDQKNTNFTLLFIYSCVFHTALLTFVLISLYDKHLNTEPTAVQIILIKEPATVKSLATKQKQIQDKKQNPKTHTASDPQKKDDSFTVPLPVMYYGNTLDKNRKPGGATNLPADKGYEQALIGALPSQDKPIAQSTLIETYGSTAAHIPDALPSSSSHEEKNKVQEEMPTKIAESLSNINTVETSKKTSFAQRKIVKSLFPQRTSKGVGQSKGVINNLGQLLPQNLLASALPQATYNAQGLASLKGEGYGQHLIIKEGDMRYYSVWKKFLHHLNQTAQYNRIRESKDSLANLRQTAGTQGFNIVKKPLSMAIIVTKDGICTGINLTSSSGNEAFDKKCIADAWSASPYPPLPNSISQDSARFEVLCYSNQ